MTTPMMLSNFGWTARSQSCNRCMRVNNAGIAQPTATRSASQEVFLRCFWFHSQHGLEAELNDSVGDVPPYVGNCTRHSELIRLQLRNNPPVGTTIHLVAKSRETARRPHRCCLLRASPIRARSSHLKFAFRLSDRQPDCQRD